MLRHHAGSSRVQIANGHYLPITSVGDLAATIRNVFVSPKLSTDLISVDQAVDNNYDVHFLVVMGSIRCLGCLL